MWILGAVIVSRMMELVEPYLGHDFCLLFWSCLGMTLLNLFYELRLPVPSQVSIFIHSMLEVIS